MVTLTEAATKELQAFFESHQDMPKSVRVFVAPGGCCGPALSMAIDEYAEGDMSEEIVGIKFVIEATLAAVLGEVTIDLGYMGFELRPEHPLPSTGGCSSCGGGCGSGSGGSCGTDGGSCCGH